MSVYIHAWGVRRNVRRTGVKHLSQNATRLHELHFFDLHLSSAGISCIEDCDKKNCKRSTCVLNDQ